MPDELARAFLERIGKNSPVYLTCMLKNLRLSTDLNVCMKARVIPSQKPQQGWQPATSVCLFFFDNLKPWKPRFFLCSTSRQHSFKCGRFTVTVLWAIDTHNTSGWRKKKPVLRKRILGIDIASDTANFSKLIDVIGSVELLNVCNPARTFLWKRRYFSGIVA